MCYSAFFDGDQNIRRTILPKNKGFPNAIKGGGECTHIVSPHTHAYILILRHLALFALLAQELIIPTHYQIKNVWRSILVS